MHASVLLCFSSFFGTPLPSSSNVCSAFFLHHSPFLSAPRRAIAGLSLPLFESSGFLAIIRGPAGSVRIHRWPQPLRPPYRHPSRFNPLLTLCHFAPSSFVLPPPSLIRVDRNHLPTKILISTRRLYVLEIHGPASFVSRFHLPPSLRFDSRVAHPPLM